MDAAVVLVELETKHDGIFSTSGLKFTERYIIVTSSIFTTFFENIDFYKYNTIEHGKLHSNFLPTDNLKLSVITSYYNKGYVNNFSVKQAHVVAIFSCKSIRNSSSAIFADWAIHSYPKNEQIKDFLSLLFVLDIECNSKHSLEELQSAFNILWQTILKCRQDISVGQDTAIESTPFGNRHFINTYSHGVISNILGDNSCFLLTDCSTAPGSEGSPIFVIHS